ncbi:MAG: phenylalanine--tRNA ligase subunit alpha [Verrucomicrobia bacterium]|nr:MAG: phenylalanine--tRNA ligase subunit alpha [Verrucomicrobiota bacterium]
MEEDLKAIVHQVESGVSNLHTLPEYENFKAKFLGTNGALTQVAKGIGKLSATDRPRIGKLVNEVKTQIEAILANTFAQIEQAELAKKLGPDIDPTLPSPDGEKGTIHPLTQIRREMDDIFRKIGFTVAEGPEIESEWYCFDALNTPDSHPARDMQDTLYFPKETLFENISRKNNERYVLRTHTSSVQIRTLMQEKPPLRIIAPGRAFRRDTVDATHSANFHQIEGLYVDKNVTVKDLKAVLDYFCTQLFGKDIKVRLRASFFPFTEPSFEVDLYAPNLGKLSNKWIEIMGCGIVDPEVFKSVNLDPEIWTGFAFGMGLERLAMIRYRIDDIRYFYNNDLRFLKQF